MQLSEDIETSLTFYRIATGDTREQAISRLMEIGLRTWGDHPHYMPERLCGPTHKRRNLHPMNLAEYLPVH
jgi:hypothetical protein